MTEPSPAFDVANIHLEHGGKRRVFPVTVALGERTPADLIPPARELAAQMIDDALAQAAAQGRTVTCKAGCGACCRQQVAITAIEAVDLAELVERMPEPRRSDVRRRFAEAVDRFERAGLIDPRLPRGRRGIVGRFPGDEAKSRDDARKRYFELGVPCPFLENESCGIHADRPLTCREYHVTTPAEYCAAIFQVRGRVRTANPPVLMAVPLGRAVGKIAGVPETLFPLVLALEVAEVHGPALRRTFDGLEMFRALLTEIDRTHAVPFEQRADAPEAMDV